ncbi:ATP-dependent nuclease [Lacicoccus alkaliphilus]|uniref:Predicted ATP-dependent endonuclease of the OLD family, contains P-loop ATPase and TOPRIM domains n=1 Tax=Lacicoccus alkaliphilus DSM 16010 TaxID=1123231 RepID=A0A1M7KJD8_9BACL|nr:AAA family ATPase [Salinicoccus alkaliphilus]SHM65508.1 Predicted ATP-dependent endonuclease of the OLD family, contains P-loop ATPase and TOPRIM domains [Salinicoccus alkaliphilus DSM 16010]
MKIEKIKIENFRSLNSIDFLLDNFLVIFGKNNEGKSNVLRAIKRFDEILEYSIDRENRYSKTKGVRLNFLYPRYDKVNNIENDIPVEIMQLHTTKKTTNIIVGFLLNDSEVNTLNGLLTSTSKATKKIEVAVSYSRDLDCKIAVKLKENGRSLSVLKNVFITLNFIRENFTINYIPSVRTEEDAMRIIENIIDDRLKDLKDNEEFHEALEKINDLQSSLLNELADQIEPDLKSYLPNIRSVDIVSSTQNLFRVMRRNIDIRINDGKNTSLVDKGDGIKSLVALSLFQRKNEKSGLLMIDEPEAHLHSGAINEIRNRIISDIEDRQILISSHHQIFVDRNHFDHNAILSSGRMHKAKDIRMIREELGIKLSENLLNAELVILVEGETDKQFFTKILELKNKKYIKLLDENRVIIDSLQGTPNLINKLSFYNSGLCKIICILDNDVATERVVDEVQEKNISSNSIYTIPKLEKDEAELEDLYEDTYIFSIVDKFFNLKGSIHRSNVGVKMKFTNKLSKILDTYGKNLKNKDENAFKWYLINDIKTLDEDTFLSKSSKDFLDPIISEIDSLLRGK